MIDFLFALPAFVKVGVAFASILVINRMGINLGWSIIGCSIFLTLWSGAGAQGIVAQILSMGKPDNYLLFFAIVLLLFFSEVLERTGRMKRTVEAIKHWLPNERLLYGGLPALVGLLPMPGGALFSAPMVSSLDETNKLQPSHKVAINYWFRHIWECWWPLYPGVVLAISYSGLTPGRFYMTMIPCSLAAVIGGYFFLLRPIAKQSQSGGSGKVDKKDLLATTGPLGLIVLLSIAGTRIFALGPFTQNQANLLALFTGVATALAIVLFRSRDMITSSLKALSGKKNRNLLLVIIGVMLFSEVLKLPISSYHSQTIVSIMRDEFHTYGIPIIFILILLPFISGAVTGLALGFVGVSFPLCFQLIGDHPSLHLQMATTALCYGFGYLGMIMSPIHLCFVVTNEYFKSKIWRAYPYIAGPVIVMVVWILGISGIYYFWR